MTIKKSGMFSSFRDKKILVTGHTGFKGSWLCFWLSRLGADLSGISLDPVYSNGSFYELGISKFCKDYRTDINDYNAINRIFSENQPEIVFHLAAQPLVLHSYKEPLYTLNTNIIGTANILEACRQTKSVRILIVITSDKCYENVERIYKYNENDRLGGKDIYSASKAAAEIIVSAYRSSFLSIEDELQVATARAGNVIGGGDWAENRILPDCIKALVNNNPVIVKNPEAIRPWQHVLEPLSGYLCLAEKMLSDSGKYDGAWNFGPENEDGKSVKKLVECTIKYWGNGEWTTGSREKSQAESGILLLDSSKARNLLNWRPRLSFENSVEMAVFWYKNQVEGNDLKRITHQQIDLYESKANDI